jgi:hypothetical protein
MTREFLKCTFCERPLSVNVELREELGFILKQACPLCGEIALHYMGQVRQTNLVRDVVKPACDLRCTSAVGPKCSCLCNNVNHGTHRLVVFDKVVGKLEVVEKDLLNGNLDYLARIKRMALAKNKIKVNVITFLNYQYRAILAESKEKGGCFHLSSVDYWKYLTYKKTLQKIDKIEDLKSIQRKINSLTHLIPTIGDTLQYLEALSLKKEQEVTV